MKIIIGVKYCGGCNVSYDRTEVLKKIESAFDESKVMFENVKENMLYDYVLILNGCLSQCADISKINSKYGFLSIVSPDGIKEACENIRILSLSLKEQI
ncbi:MAG: hypothetical protein LKJ13_04280 [Clostridia bacterium]|jgi:4-hydroxybutyrate CoA-transferase|nr:hypothetical protein [Clostridia bacterium]MCI2001070.1 hypothetical protein [Clostridia bacterium]MCI2015804.1 hypothetical protein [Clostridia bacterium]